MQIRCIAHFHNDIRRHGADTAENAVGQMSWICRETFLARNSIFSEKTANIVMEMGYATDLHREALLGTAVCCSYSS